MACLSDELDYVEPDQAEAVEGHHALRHHRARLNVIDRFVVSGTF